MSPLPNMSDLLALLHTNSPLSLIHRYLDIQTIDSGEILEKLQKTVVDIDDENERQTKEKRKFSFILTNHTYIIQSVFAFDFDQSYLLEILGVRFTDVPPNAIESLRLPQTSASMIFLGYLAINSVVQRILSTDGNQSDDLFSQTRSYLIQIYPLRFRLELLENIFSLVFIQQTELKADESIEGIEQSTNNTSITVSTPDRFVSSLQSNLTNDSFHTSTNASIKTQVSIRKFDNDLDEHDTDDVSVCSSSMSSVGASHHHSIYRSGLIINQQILYQILIFLRDQLSEVRTLNQKIKDKATDRDTVGYETSLDKCFLGCSINTNEQFTTRATKLNTIVSETLWRYQLLTANNNELTGQENRTDGHENEENLVSNPAIKTLILPVRKFKKELHFFYDIHIR